MVAVQHVIVANYLIDIDHRKVAVRIRLTKPLQAVPKMAALRTEVPVEVADSAYASHDGLQRDIRHPELHLADRPLLAPVVIKGAEPASRTVAEPDRAPSHQPSDNPVVGSRTHLRSRSA
jgi:hypothetical protein